MVVLCMCVQNLTFAHLKFDLGMKKFYETWKMSTRKRLDGASYSLYIQVAYTKFHCTLFPMKEIYSYIVENHTKILWKNFVGIFVIEK